MSGVGAMMAGGNPADGRVENDFYGTPEEAPEAILRVEKFDGVMHECACGDGAMSRVIERHGYKVVSSDLIDRGYGKQRDFFSIKKWVGHNIMSNPPWNIADQFIEHAMTVLHPRKMAFLLKANYFHAAKRAALFEKYPPVRIYPLTWRLDFQGKKRPVIECSWYIWEHGNKNYPTYQLLHRPAPKAIRAEFAISESLAA